MNIVQIMPDFGIAGAEIMCENLTYELIKLGHNVIVVSLYDYHSAITDRLEKADIDVRYLGKKYGLDFSMIKKIKKILKESNADVIHTHRHCTKYAVPAAIMAGVKNRVHTIHNIAEKEDEKLARKLNKFFFKYCNLIPVALSELVRDSVIKEYRINKCKIPVIYNGIDLSKCKPKTDYSVDGKFKILHIGRFYEQKNHIGLLQAFKLFHENRTNTELWLVGNGEKKPEIESYVTRNNLTSSVKFLGLQSNVYSYLHDADIFTLPSNYEGMPMSIIEAMGTGLPIVATAVGGVPDMLNYESALLVPIDVEELSKAFEQYYNNIELRKNHGTNAYALSDKFSARTMAERYCSIYKGES